MNFWSKPHYADFSTWQAKLSGPNNRSRRDVRLRNNSSFTLFKDIMFSGVGERCAILSPQNSAYTRRFSNSWATNQSLEKDQNKCCCRLTINIYAGKILNFRQPMAGDCGSMAALKVYILKSIYLCLCPSVNLSIYLSLCMYIHIYILIYLSIFTCLHVYVYKYKYIYIM